MIGYVFQKFEDTWNFLHVIGAIDGKHIRIECPKLSGSLDYNYKGCYSFVLLAVCEANYCFTLLNLGQTFEFEAWQRFRGK